MAIGECMIAHEFQMVRIQLLRTEISVSLVSSSWKPKQMNDQLICSLCNFRLGKLWITGRLPDKGMKFKKPKTFRESALLLKKKTASIYFSFFWQTFPSSYFLGKYTFSSLLSVIHCVWLLQSLCEELWKQAIHVTLGKMLEAGISVCLPASWNMVHFLAGVGISGKVSFFSCHLPFLSCGLAATEAAQMCVQCLLIFSHASMGGESPPLPLPPPQKKPRQKTCRS